MNSSRGRVVLGLSFALLSVTSYALVSAQAQQLDAALVIEGATLIDGNGGAPLPDSAIVIRGNRIASVSRRGQVTYPRNAQVINAAGRFVMPGLFDSQVSYEWYLAEPLLAYGVTSTIDVGTSGETAIQMPSTNIFNPDGTYQPTAGRITIAGPARQLQFGIKFLF